MGRGLKCRKPLKSLELYTEVQLLACNQGAKDWTDAHPCDTMIHLGMRLPACTRASHTGGSTGSWLQGCQALRCRGLWPPRARSLLSRARWNTRGRDEDGQRAQVVCAAGHGSMAWRGGRQAAAAGHGVRTWAGVLKLRQVHRMPLFIHHRHLQLAPAQAPHQPAPTLIDQQGYRKGKARLIDVVEEGWLQCARAAASLSDLFHSCAPPNSMTHAAIQGQAAASVCLSLHHL